MPLQFLTGGAHWVLLVKTAFLEVDLVRTADILHQTCLLLLMLGKKIVSEKEVMVMTSFAKTRLESGPDPESGRQASAYIDMLLRTLQPDAGPPPGVSH